MTYLTDINFVDLLIVVFLFCCIVAGIIRGFTSDMLGMFTWVGGVICTYMLLPYSSPFISQWITESSIAKIVAIATSFLLSIIILVLINKGISYLVKNSILGGLDKALGLVSGIIRTVVISTGLYLLSLFFINSDNIPSMLVQSKLMKVLDYTAIFSHKQLCKHKDFCPDIQVVNERNRLSSVQTVPKKTPQQSGKTVKELLKSL